MIHNVDIPICVVTGSGAIIKGIRTGNRLLLLRGIAQVVPSFSEVSRTVLETTIKNNFGASGQEFINNWKLVNAGLSVAGLVTEGFLEIPQLMKMVRSYNTLKATNATQLATGFSTPADFTKFDAMMTALSAGDNFRLGVSNPSKMRVLLTPAEITNIKGFALVKNATDNCTDLIIHSVNNVYKVFIEKAGKFDEMP